MRPTTRQEYNLRHVHLRKERGLAAEQDCVDCNKPAVEWSHKHDTDVEDFDNYYPRCIPCHRKYDAPLLRKGRQQRRKREQNIFL